MLPVGRDQVGPARPHGPPSLTGPEGCPLRGPTWHLPPPALFRKPPSRPVRPEAEGPAPTWRGLLPQDVCSGWFLCLLTWLFTCPHWGSRLPGRATAASGHCGRPPEAWLWGGHGQCWVSPPPNNGSSHTSQGPCDPPKPVTLPPGTGPRVNRTSEDRDRTRGRCHAARVPTGLVSAQHSFTAPSLRASRLPRSRKDRENKGKDFLVAKLGDAETGRASSCCVGPPQARTQGPRASSPRTAACHGDAQGFKMRRPQPQPPPCPEALQGPQRGTGA